MAQNTPDAVFLTAQQAIARGDWETFFTCLDRSDLVRLGGVALSGVLGAPAGLNERFFELCAHHGISTTTLTGLRTLTEEIRTSAQRMARFFAESPTIPGVPKFSMEASLKHQALVKAHTQLLDEALSAVSDLAAFNAAAERLKREALGGGSVSSSMFVNETLLDVKINGAKATGTRHRARGSDEPISFVKKKGQWFVKLLPGRGAQPR